MKSPGIAEFKKKSVDRKGIPTCPINLATLRTRLPDLGSWSLPHICKEAVTNSGGTTTPEGASGNYSSNITATADAFYQPTVPGSLHTVPANGTAVTVQPTAQQHYHQTNLHKHYKAHKKMPAFRGRRGWCG
uniref:Uncharacterized protein n=1 Tax=Anopheles minimus TaxID=112268 RepID=A0A182VQM1_9DIPT